MSATLRLAVAQSPADLAFPQDRISWLRSVLPSIAAANAELLLLPELFATGYNIGDLIRERAEPADGPVSTEIGRMAAEYGIAIHFGFAERSGKTIFNAAQCFGPDGNRLTLHRKLVLPPGFETEIFAPGEGCNLFEYRGFRIATLICFDAEFPETARHVAMAGAELILVPTALGANWAWVADSMIPTRGYENGVFIAYANSAGTENGLTYLGRSFVAAPDGAEISRAGTAPEVLLADLAHDRVAAAQSRLPYLQARDRLRLTTDSDQ